jgi:hypothetical protein
MLKKLFAKTTAKKTSLLAVAFVLLCAAAGIWLLNREPTATGQASPVIEADGSAVAEAVNSLSVQGDSFPQSGEYPSLREEPVFTAPPTDPAPEPPALEAMLPVQEMEESFVYIDDIPLSYELQHYTYQRCLDEKLDYEMVLALMWRESGFQVDAVGHNTNGTQDSGVMQINDVNKGWLQEDHGITNLMDPYQNIDAGTIILGDFTKKYGAQAALMAYQYGEQGMKKKHAQGIYTNDLITKLMTKRSEIQELVRQESEEANEEQKEEKTQRRLPLTRATKE